MMKDSEDFEEMLLPCAKVNPLRFFRVIRMDCIDILGSQPVSMDRENMKYLSKIDYCVCEKTDGVRYLLLIYNVFA